MAVKHVITEGFGFADNTDFIPTEGFGDFTGGGGSATDPQGKITRPVLVAAVRTVT